MAVLQNQHFLPKRKTVPHWLFSCLTLLLFLIFTSSLSAKDHVTLRVGIYENTPLIFPKGNNKAGGLYSELLEYIASSEGWKLEYVPAPWEALLTMLERGDLDMLSTVAYSDKRSERFYFNDETIIVNWAEAFSSTKTTPSSIFDLEGKRVAVKAGDIHFEILKELTEKFGIQCRFIETDSYSTIFEMLDAKYLDFGIVNRLFGRANKYDYQVKHTPIIFNPIELRFAFNKSIDRDIITILDQHLYKLKNDQESLYHNSIEKWLSIQEKSRLPRYLTYGMGVTFILFFFLFFINLILRFQVSRQTKNLQNTNEHLKEEIIKRQKAMQELKKYARVVEASSDAVALFDYDHNHLLVNQAYLELFEKERDDLQDQNLFEVVGRDLYNTYLREPIEQCLEGEQVSLQATYTLPGSKTVQHWHIQMGPYIVSQSVILGYVLDIRDITEKVELENKLANAQRMETIGIMAGGVAHDLNNILSGLVSYPDMLLLNRPEDDPMYAPLHTIKRSGKRAAEIVSDLLTLARRNVDNNEPVSLNHLLKELQSSPEYSMLLGNSDNVEIIIDLDNELLNINGSGVHIAKCIMNLFSNGLDAMRAGGTLTISTSNYYVEKSIDNLNDIPIGEYVTLTITDTGSGMEQETIEHIFEPFYTSKVMGRSGTGLGMTLVWGTVQDHNGHIKVDSKPGHGTTFTLYFPATREAITEKEHDNLANLDGRGESVLVIDDMEEQRLLASEILTRFGYSVDTAANGKDALKKITTQSYDILVLDMIMPGGMDGLETYQQILKKTPSQKAVIASGYSESDKVAQVQDLGAGEFIRKPYTVFSLANAIKKELS